MKTLLFLVHRIPYPPNKGDKIRSHQLLKFLSKRYRVLVGAFVDHRDDWRFRQDVEALCSELLLLPLVPFRARLRSLVGLATNEPLTLPYYRDRRMAHWVGQKVERGVDAILVFSSSMAQYAEPFSRSVARSVIDFVDLDSEKWRQYGAARGGVIGAIYRREARLLADYERKMAQQFSHSTFVSDAEARPLMQQCPGIAARIHVVSNGVDHAYFDPAAALANPYAAGARVAVFTGAMDYWANVDAVQWFATAIWPAIRQAESRAQLFIVGAHPTNAVRELGRLAGVHVTGAVDDVRPYLKFAALAVAPLRIARGIQNKILEALAMGLPVVATSAAAQGLTGTVRARLQVTDDPEEWSAAVLRALDGGARNAHGNGNREAVLGAYDWDNNLLILHELLSSGARIADEGSPGR